MAVPLARPPSGPPGGRSLLGLWDRELGRERPTEDFFLKGRSMSLLWGYALYLIIHGRKDNEMSMGRFVGYGVGLLQFGV